MDECQNKSLCGGAVGAFFVACSEKIGNQRIDTNAESDGKRVDKILNREDEGQRCHGIFIDSGDEQTVYNIIKPYIGIYKSANQQETAQIQGLLLDLDKEGVPALIQTLGLKEIQDSLRAANDEYAKLTAQRTGNRAASIKEASMAVRLRMDDLYDDMTTIAFVQSVAAPTAETARFVNELNALIDETTALYNQRIGAAKAAAKKKEKP